MFMDKQKELERMRSVRPPQYWQSLNFSQLVKDYPPPPDYFNTVYVMPPEQIRELQAKRFKVQIERAWQVPFYARRWKEAGLTPDDIRTPEDLVKIKQKLASGLPEETSTANAGKKKPDGG